MSDNRNRPSDGSPPDATAMVADYFERLRAAGLSARAHLVAHPGEDGEDVIEDLQAHVRDRLHDSAGTPDDVTRVLSELGSPEALAAELAAPSWDDADRLHAEDGHALSSGRVLGIPYNLRTPSSERYASGFWNPLDRRIFVPKAWGMGWTINLGALAVLTRVVRPDDEDVPFGTVAPRTVAATLVVPVVALVAFAVLAATSWTHLPARVPTHWGISGAADRYGSPAWTLLFLSLLAAVPVALAALVHLRRRPPFSCVVASAVSLATVALALSLLTQTLFTLGGGVGVWPIWIGLVCSLALPFVLLVSVSRIGRAAEQRRDLSEVSRKRCAR